MSGVREETTMAELDPRAAGARRLRDKVCVVTGAGQGIGRATARRLGEEGGKIVVAERYRKKGVADGLMHEFLNRLRSGGVRHVTTGFFRPEYFYGYGFRIEKRFAGLVKDLAETAISSASGS